MHYASLMRDMDSIARLIPANLGISADASVGDAQKLFAASPAHFLAVSDDGRPAGLLERDAVMAMTDRSQAVSAVMTGDPLLLTGDLAPIDAAQAVAARRGGTDGFLICSDGRVTGAGSLRELLAAMDGSQSQAPDFKRDFLALVSQELGGPIDGVLALSDLLSRQPLGVDAKAHLRAIQDAGRSLRLALDAALDLTRAEQGLLDLAQQPTPLRALLDEVQADWSPRARQDGVTLLASYDGDPEMAVLTDRVRLKQVFDSLVESALLHTRQGFVEVTLRAAVDGDQIQVEGRVRDTSDGAGPEQLARIFEPASTLGAGSGPGGLGLALARRIILELNGVIRAESNVGAGVSVVFDMMCEAARESEPARNTAAAGAAHILVVDDNATNRMVAEALVEMFDCTSETAVDGVEAVEMARSGRFDVILMDIKMPRMDGMAATRAIRALPGAAGRAPIIALTANADPEDSLAYLACGMMAVVEKPIKPDKLLTAINAALKQLPDRRGAAAAA